MDRVTLPVVQDIVSWYSNGFIKAAQMRRTYEGTDGADVYHVVLTVRKPAQAREGSLLEATVADYDALNRRDN